MLWRRNDWLCFLIRGSFTKSGLLLPGQCAAIWDPADPTSKQMASYFTHPDQIPVSDSEKLDNTIDACVTTLDRVIGYCRAGSVFPQTFGLACCAMEMIEACYSIDGVINRLLPLDSISSVLVWFLVLRKAFNIVSNGIVLVRLILWLCLELLQTRWLLPSVVYVFKGWIRIINRFTIRCLSPDMSFPWVAALTVEVIMPIVTVWWEGRRIEKMVKGVNGVEWIVFSLWTIMCLDALPLPMVWYTLFWWWWRS